MAVTVVTKIELNAAEKIITTTVSQQQNDGWFRSETNQSVLGADEFKELFEFWSSLDGAKSYINGPVYTFVLAEQVD